MKDTVILEAPINLSCKDTCSRYKDQHSDQYRCHESYFERLMQCSELMKFVRCDNQCSYDVYEMMN